MRFTVREMGPADRDACAAMRAALWPDQTAEVLAKDLNVMLGSGAAWGFIAETAAGGPVGFAEIAVRPSANGCDSRPVPFLEGIWVAPQFRRQGLGAQLMKHVEAFVTARGFCEIGSDALIDNHASHAAHRGWGFSETERVVYFRKVLDQGC